MYRKTNYQTSLGALLFRIPFLADRGHANFSPRKKSWWHRDQTSYYKEGQRWIESFPIGRAYLHQRISVGKFPWQRSSLVSRWLQLQHERISRSPKFGILPTLTLTLSVVILIQTTFRKNLRHLFTLAYKTAVIYKLIIMQLMISLGAQLPRIASDIWSFIVRIQKLHTWGSLD